jgi:hypothetical protein
VLIHCQPGIDRTGLAVVVSVLLLDESGSPAGALAQLKLWYGHIHRRCSVRHQKKIVQMYEASLAATNSAHSTDRFRGWTRCVYTNKVESSARDR